MKKQKKVTAQSKPLRDASSSDAVPPVTQVRRRNARHRSEGRAQSSAELRGKPASGSDVAPIASNVVVTSKYQEMYLAARTADAAGRIQLDQQRFAQSLAEAGVGSLAEQELYNLALLAAADGHASLFKEDVALALRKAS